MRDLHLDTVIEVGTGNVKEIATEIVIVIDITLIVIEIEIGTETLETLEILERPENQGNLGKGIAQEVAVRGSKERGKGTIGNGNRKSHQEYRDQGNHQLKHLTLPGILRQNPVTTKNARTEIEIGKGSRDAVAIARETEIGKEKGVRNLIVRDTKYYTFD